MNSVFGNNSSYAALAPMAGVSDRAFRDICLEHKAAFVVTEMVSSKALICSGNKTEFLMESGDNISKTIIQIFGSDPEAMVYAAAFAQDKGCIGIDINMGCPAPKVSSTGAGSALMRTPSLAFEITEKCAKAVSLPLSVKMRIGWDDNSVNAVEFAKGLENAGACCLTVHGRTRKQMYSPPVDFDTIKAVKEAVKIPVIGNGDIACVADAVHMYEYTGCDFIMIGRGALGNPWIFEQINSYFSDGIIKPEPDVTEKTDEMLRHIRKMCEYKGEYVGMREARKHAGWYTKGLRGAAALRKEMGAIEHIEDLEKIRDKIIEMNCQ